MKNGLLKIVFGLAVVVGFAGAFYAVDPLSVKAGGGGGGSGWGGVVGVGGEGEGFGVPPVLHLLGLQLPKGFERDGAIENERWAYGTLIEPNGWVFEQRLVSSERRVTTDATAKRVKAVYEHYQGQVRRALREYEEREGWESPSLSYVAYGSKVIGESGRLKLMVFELRPGGGGVGLGEVDASGRGRQVGPTVVVRLTLTRDGVVGSR